LVVVVLLADVRSAIGFSSFTVLLYYAVTNASAYTLKPNERLFDKKLATAGLTLCVVLAFTLPFASVIAGSVVMSVGLAVFILRQRETRDLKRRV
jgi:APA family basic amino acid/polyamine antiporter